MGLTGLSWQLVDVKFTAGLDTRTQQKLVVPGKWRTLGNLTLGVDDSTRKRPAWRPLPGPSGNGVATYNDELLVVDGPFVSSVSLAANNSVIVPGSVANVDVAKEQVINASGLIDSPDSAAGAGFICHVWRSKTLAGVVTGVNVSVVDESTGTKLINGVSMRATATVGRCRVVFVPDALGGDAFFIFYLDGTDLVCRVVLASASSTLGAEVVLISDIFLGANICPDAVASPGSTEALIAYRWTNLTASVRASTVLQVAGVPALNATADVIPEAQITTATLSAICCVPLDGSTALTPAYAIFAKGGAAFGLFGGTWKLNLAQVTASAVIAAGVSANAGPQHLTGVKLSNTSLALFWDEQSWLTSGSAGLAPVIGVILNSVLAPTSGPLIVANSYAPGPVAPTTQATGPWICGKPFLGPIGKVYLPVCELPQYDFASLQPAVFVLDVAVAGVALQRGVVVAKALYGTYGGLSPYTSGAGVVTTPPSTPLLVDGVTAVLAAQEKNFLEIFGGANDSASGLVQLDFTPNADHSIVRKQLGQETFWAGGCLTTYDGSQVVEHGFPLYPETPQHAASVTTGTGCTAGVHQLCWVYEWIDGAGQRHQSAPSLPQSHTVIAGVNQNITATVPTLLLSQKVGVTIVGYMTAAAGLIFYRCTDPLTPTLNTLAAGSVAVVVAVVDATLLGNELLYTQPDQAGTTLANIAPGPARAMCVHQNRLFVDVADQPLQYRYSQQQIQGVGLQFSDALGGSVDSNSGGIVGFEALDEKVILFCRNRPYVIYGSGPNASGGFNQYSDPQEIPSDVGCSEARSILRVPSGIIFKSVKGWYLLGRDLQVRDIGDGVAAYDANPVSSAVMLQSERSCCFASSSGTHLTFDYQNEQWSTYYLSPQSDLPYRISDAIWWPTLGAYVHVSITDGLNQDEVLAIGASSTGSDSVGARGPFAISFTWQTGFLHLGQLGAFQRVRWLYLTGAGAVSGGLTTTLVVDYDDAYGNVAPGSYTVVLGLPALAIAAGMPVDIRHKLRRQKCKSIAFTFGCGGSDAVNFDGFQALTLQVGMKRGTNKLKAAQGIG